MEQTKTCLYGAGGHGKVILDIFEANNIQIQAVIDDNASISEVLGVPVIHKIPDENCPVLISIGNNKTRKNIAEVLGCDFSTAIHPSAIISKHVTIGEGTAVMAGVIINPDSVIGKHCIINTGAILEHDNTIGDFAHISPGAVLAGNVSIGQGTHIGTNVSVIPNVKIGKWATIGAGSVIISDVPDHAVVVGNPGRIIKYNSHE
ncbi:acetyltransferase [Flavobacterium silvaticum]|uniref:Acetyltransferase n=1 Tax=Flavobacterium silvaticum TaxID=1852020 RepID=A0A972FWV2_9FLAO|nr:acetyltransferase [Flavobacterium silvaticum]NMH29497.1 acetyltransferase [Flavobacterium silvaticum]